MSGVGRVCMGRAGVVQMKEAEGCKDKTVIFIFLSNVLLSPIFQTWIIEVYS